MAAFNKTAQVEALSKVISSLQDLRTYIQDQPDEAVVIEDATWRFPYTTESSDLATRVRREYESALRTILCPAQYLYEVGLMPANETSSFRAVIELDVPDALDPEETVSVDELASRTSTVPDRLQEILLVLANFGVFEEVEAFSRNWRHTEHSLMLRKGHPSLIRPTFGYGNEEMVNSLSKLTDLLRAENGSKSGAELFYGKPIFEFLNDNPANAERFNDMMRAMNNLIVGGLVEDYDWKALGDRTIVDLGSGIGAQEMFLAPRYTNLHFICLDLPHVVEHGKEFWEQNMPKEVAQRVQFRAHDFFEPQIQQLSDVYWMRFILHDWKDEDAVKILTALRKNIQSGTKLLLAEVIVDENISRWQQQLNMQILAVFNAKERTLKEFHSLADQSGWRIEKLWKTRGPLGILECVA